jgi:hypothetical protein
MAYSPAYSFEGKNVTSFSTWEELYNYMRKQDLTQWYYQAN